MVEDLMANVDVTPDLYQTIYPQSLLAIQKQYYNLRMTHLCVRLAYCTQRWYKMGGA